MPRAGRLGLALGAITAATLMGQPVDLGIPGITGAFVIGSGGFAVVYRAFQPTFERYVAVKVIEVPSLDEATRKAFRRECAAIGRLSGRPNILTVHDAGLTTSGKPYLIMAYLARGTLQDRLDSRGPVAWQLAVAIGVKLSRALESAHQAGVLHRDLKPANILMSDENEPQLADFGIARIADATSKSRSGLALTPVHAPPELWAGSNATATADVYSLASTLFALIAGRPAFVEDADDSVFVVIGRVATAPVPDLRPRGVPDAVCQVIEEAMAKDPAARPASAALFGARLEEAWRETTARLRAAGTPPAAPPPATPPPVAPSSVATPSVATPSVPTVAEVEAFGTSETVSQRAAVPPTVPAPVGPTSSSPDEPARRVSRPGVSRIRVSRTQGVVLVTLVLLAVGLSTAWYLARSSSQKSETAGTIAHLDDIAPVMLERPPFPLAATDPAGTPERELIVDSQQDIPAGDDSQGRQKWLVDNGLSVPTMTIAPADANLPGSAAHDVNGHPVSLPGSVPRNYRGHPLLTIIQYPDRWFLLFGQQIRLNDADTFRAAYVVAVDPALTNVSYAYDFSNYSYPPERATTDKDGQPLADDDVFESVRWVVQVGRMMYVSHGHDRYAADSQGLTSYITAVDLDTSTLRWRSAALTSNAHEFQVMDDVVVSGYGFTDEPDSLFLLDARSGDMFQRMSVRSAPDHILSKAGTVFVRCYDIDYTLHVG